MINGAESIRARSRWVEPVGAIILLALTVLFAAISWRKWPDPLIDFGAQLYTPWRLANGALLYRDVDCLYGPLSQYFNAGLFALFGPGLMALVTANLIIFAAIVTVLYLLCRQAWGIAGALTASALFIVVFGFSQFVGRGNYNYATPYAHETTHGLLICLLLTWALVKWTPSLTIGRSFLLGLLFGTTALLKPEFLLAAGVVSLAAAFMVASHWRRPRLPEIGIWLLGALLPTVTFAAYFARFLPWNAAFANSCHGWLSVLTAPGLTHDPIQIGFLGLDQPWRHGQEHVVATLIAAGLFAAIGAVAGAAQNLSRRLLALSLGAALFAALSWLAWRVINWLELGPCLLGVLLLYLLGTALLPASEDTAADRLTALARRLAVILAAAMMARMILNGRIYQFGFYQAALAAVIIPAAFVSELPVRLRLNRRGRAILLAGSCALLLPGIVRLELVSQRWLQLKTFRVGDGRDQFWAFPQEVDPTGEAVDSIFRALSNQEKFKSLLVLPEGAMINYLTRLPNPVAPYFFFSAVTENGGEQSIVTELGARPPDMVIIISHDLEEYGIQRYGERPGRGALLLKWINDEYREYAHWGDDPLDPNQWGAAFFQHR